MPRLPSQQERWDKWLAENPCPPNEPGAPCVNDWIYKEAAYFCASTREHIVRKGSEPGWRIPPETAVEFIRSALTRPEKTPYEVVRQVGRQYGRKFERTDGADEPVEEVLSYDANGLREHVSKLDLDITDQWLMKASPIPVDRVTPADYLDSIFYVGDKVCVSRTYTDTGFIYHVGGGRYNQRERLNNYTSCNDNGAWFLSNPVNGTPIDDSLRSGANLVAFRHILLESDCAPDDLWLKFLVHLDRPIISIQRSGNTSIHALVKIDAETSVEFDKIRQEFLREFVPFGACKGSIRAVQQVRLPNVVRQDNGRRQTLLYLNPVADGNPISF
jgi:hypothetical protein